MAGSVAEKIDRKDREKSPFCKVGFSVGDKRFTGVSSDFNEVGMLVRCPEPAPLNMRVKLTVEFPGMANPIEVWGEVVWTNQYGTDDAVTPRGMGVRFSEEDLDSVRMISDVAIEREVTNSVYQTYYS